MQRSVILKHEKIFQDIGRQIVAAADFGRTDLKKRT